jgi:hypothetical protein
MMHRMFAEEHGDAAEQRLVGMIGRPELIALVRLWSRRNRCIDPPPK